jgi:hypothetical protein
MSNVSGPHTDRSSRRNPFRASPNSNNRLSRFLSRRSRVDSCDHPWGFRRHTRVPQSDGKEILSLFGAYEIFDFAEGT